MENRFDVTTKAISLPSSLSAKAINAQCRRTQHAATLLLFSFVEKTLDLYGRGIRISTNRLAKNIAFSPMQMTYSN